MPWCAWCLGEMDAQRTTKRFCSARCRAAYWNAERREERERLAALQVPAPPIDTAAVKAAILELLEDGAKTSEALVWRLKDRGLIPGSPKATGAAFSALRKSGQIRVIGHGPRLKARGASGAVVYTLSEADAPVEPPAPSANPMDYDKPVRVVAGVIGSWRRLHPDDCPDTPAGWAEKFEDAGWDIGTVEEALRLIAALEDSVSTS